MFNHQNNQRQPMLYSTLFMELSLITGLTKQKPVITSYKDVTRSTMKLSFYSSTDKTLYLILYSFVKHTFFSVFPTAFLSLFLRILIPRFFYGRSIL